MLYSMYNLHIDCITNNIYHETSYFRAIYFENKYQTTYELFMNNMSQLIISMMTANSRIPNGNIWSVNILKISLLFQILIMVTNSFLMVMFAEALSTIA